MGFTPRLASPTRKKILRRARVGDGARDREREREVAADAVQMVQHIVLLLRREARKRRHELGGVQQRRRVLGDAVHIVARERDVEVFWRKVERLPPRRPGCPCAHYPVHAAPFRAAEAQEVKMIYRNGRSGLNF